MDPDEVDVKAYLREAGIPNKESPSEGPRGDFPDGSHYKIEMLPTTVKEYKELIQLANNHDVTINRITDVRGTTFDTDNEIREKCKICRDNDIELLMAPGMGEHEGDIGQQVAIDAMQHGKLRGKRNLNDAVKELLRALSLGCRGFIIYDEGLLNVCLKMRADDVLPSDTMFKLSSLFSVANPSSLTFWGDLLNPRDSINPVRDLTVPMLSAMRTAIQQPLDIHAFWQTKVVRTPDAAEIAMKTAPVYFKNARSGTHVWSEITLEDQLLQSKRLVEAIERENSHIEQASSGQAGFGLPN